MQPPPGNTQPKSNHESRVVRCPNCGHHNPPGQKFCGACGNALQAQTAPRESVKPSPVVHTRKPSKKKMSPTIIGAIITVIGGIVIALLGFFLPKISISNADKIAIIAHVTNLNDNTAIANAQVIILAKGVSYTAHTDTQGIAAFTIDQPEKGNTQVFVQAAQYVAYDANVPLEGDQNFDIPLTPVGSGDHHVIVRVVDTDAKTPLESASVVLTANGNIFSQPTDSNGISRFVLSFTTSLLDAQIQVTKGNFKTNQQNVTLQPETVQDIRLDRSTNTFEKTDFHPSGTISSISSDPQNIAYGQSLAGVINTPGQVNVYSFEANANDAIVVRNISVSKDIVVLVTLLGPDGKSLRDNESFYSDFSEILPASGKYTITVELNTKGLPTGAYWLSLQKTN